MANSTHPEMPSLYHFAIYRPGNDKKAPEIKVQVGSCRLLFTSNEGQALFGPPARQKAEDKANEIRKLLPPGWELKITEVPFTVTRGTPKIIGRCPRATCKSYNVPMDGTFFCGICGEPLQLIWGGTLE